jgi:hypothetical protein
MVYRSTVKEKNDGHFVYSFSADRQNELSAPQTLHAAVSNGENSKADTQPNIRIDENDPSVNSNSMNTDKKIQRGQGRLSAKDSSGNALTVERSAKNGVSFNRRRLSLFGNACWEMAYQCE